MSELVITPENIRTGSFTDRQLSDFAGFPVATAKLPDLPNWNVVRADSHLTRFQYLRKHHAAIKERRNAIMHLLAEAGFSITRDAKSSKQAAYQLAITAGPGVRSITNLVVGPGDMHTFFSDVTRHGIDSALNNMPVREWGKGLGAMPYYFLETATENIPVEQVDGKPAFFKKSNAFILLNGNDNFAKNCAWDLGLRVEQVKRLPRKGLHDLIAAAHEAGHLPELGYNADFDINKLTREQINNGDYQSLKQFNNWIVMGYQELKSDALPHALLRNYMDRTPRLPSQDRNEIEDALTWDRNMRYVSMRFAPPNYWFAPILDAVESGKTPPSYYSVHQSVMEIRLRVMAEADRLQRAREEQPVPEKITSGELNQTVAGWRRYPGAEPYLPVQAKQICGVDLRSDCMVNLGLLAGGVRPGIDNLYLEWKDRQLSNQPEIFYTLLKKSLTDGAFDANPLTGKIAGKMVAAAEYFDPTLTAMPNVAEAIQLPEQGYRSKELQRLARQPDASASPLPPAAPVLPAAFLPKPAEAALVARPGA